MTMEIKLLLDDEAAERFELMKSNADITNDQEILRRAMRLYEWHLEQKNDEYKVQLKKSGVVYDVDFCGLL